MTKKSDMGFHKISTLVRQKGKILCVKMVFEFEQKFLKKVEKTKIRACKADQIAV